MPNTKRNTLFAGTLTASAVFLTLALGACSTSTPKASTMSSSASAMPASASATGVVQGVERVDQKEAGIGVGTIAGAVVGGLVGNQVGSGTGRTAATVAGAAGGAMGGHAIEDRMQRSSGSSLDSTTSGSSGEAYRVTLRMDDGSQQVFATDVDPQLRVGQRIQVVNGIVMHY